MTEGTVAARVAGPATFQASDAGAGLRQGRLNLLDVIAQSVTVIAPGLSAGVVSYLAATKAGGATPLSYLLAMLGTLCIGGVVSEFGRRLPSAGSIYTYTAAGLSRLAGFVVGWSYAITFVILGGAVLAGFGYFASSLVQRLTDGPAGPTTVPWYWFFLGGLVLVAVMSLFDVRVSTRAQLAFTAVSVVIMVTAAVIVVGQGSPAGTANPGAHLDLGAFWPAAAGVPWSGVLFGLAFGILSFTGFETGAVLAEETADPRRNIPRAVVGSVVAAGAFYLLATYATAIGFGVRDARAAWPGAAAGLVAVTPYAWLGKLVLFAIATSCLFAALGIHTVVSRTIYAMGRERVLPAGLGTTHRHWQTPWTAIVVSLGLIALVTAVAVTLMSGPTKAAVAAVRPDRVDVNIGGLAAFAYLATLGTPAVMFSYCLLGLAGAAEGRRAGNPVFTALGLGAAGTGIVAGAGSLYYSFVDGAIFVNRLVPLLVLTVLGSGLVVGLFLRHSRREAWAAMGRVFEA